MICGGFPLKLPLQVKNVYPYPLSLKQSVDSSPFMNKSFIRALEKVRPRFSVSNLMLAHGLSCFKRLFGLQPADIDDAAASRWEAVERERTGKCRASIE